MAACQALTRECTEWNRRSGAAAVAFLMTASWPGVPRHCRSSSPHVEEEAECPAESEHGRPDVDDRPPHELLRGHVAPGAGKPVSLKGERTGSVLVQVAQKHLVIFEVVEHAAVVEVDGYEIGLLHDEVGTQDGVQGGVNPVKGQLPEFRHRAAGGGSSPFAGPCRVIEDVMRPSRGRRAPGRRQS